MNILGKSRAMTWLHIKVQAWESRPIYGECEGFPALEGLGGGTSHLQAFSTIGLSYTMRIWSSPPERKKALVHETWTQPLFTKENLRAGALATPVLGTSPRVTLNTSAPLATPCPWANVCQWVEGKKLPSKDNPAWLRQPHQYSSLIKIKPDSELSFFFFSTNWMRCNLYWFCFVVAFKKWFQCCVP